jgi:deoxyribodipyrimidine photo-lyase
MSPVSSLGLVWFRNDLRLEHNPAWAAATIAHDSVAGLVTIDPAMLAAAGPFRRNQWLANVAALDAAMQASGGGLTVRVGSPEAAFADLGADIAGVYLNRATSEYGIRRDARALRNVAAPVHQHWGTLTAEPGSVLTGKGTLSRVFTPFWKVWARTPLAPWPEAGTANITTLRSDPIPAHDPPPLPAGTDGAHEQLSAWLEHVDDYPDTRDTPSIPGTSQLSTALRMGTMAPRSVLDIVGTSTPGREGFVRQLAWRDWYAHLLLENPQMLTHSIRPEYDNIEWIDDPVGLQAWKDGRTGYPLVDAGMRQLAATGWMHNRVRMVTASFLVKHLLIDWREGERWFRWMLTDAEPSQNAGNWQWVSGVGTDAAPYFRIFNPLSQSRKFDGSGAYIRRWVPELAGLDAKAIHAPWETAPLELAAAGVILGDSYPHPIVDHAMARERTLSAYKSALGKD